LERLNPSGLTLLREHRFWAGTLGIVSTLVWMWLAWPDNLAYAFGVILMQLGSTFGMLMVAPWMFSQVGQSVSDFRLLAPPTGVYALWMVPLIELWESGAV